MMKEQNAKEILLSILDAGRVPLIWRTIRMADKWLAIASVTNGHDTCAEITVATYSFPNIRIKVYRDGYESEFIAKSADLSAVVEDAAEFIANRIRFRLITFADIFGEVADEVDDLTYELYAER
jgi:hypothetical protein